METSSTLETLNIIFWILHFSTATYDHWSSCYFRYIQHMRGHFYLWLRHCDAAWHGMCQVPCDRLDSKPTFVLFHNDTRYTRKFKFSIGHVGIAVMVSTNISYQPSYLQVNMISTGTRHGGSKSGVLSVYFNLILLCQNIETSRFN